MSAAGVSLVALASITFVLKAVGPVALSGRQLSPRLARMIALMPLPLLAALIVASTISHGEAWEFDARIAGLGAAAFALWRRLPFIVVVLLAGAATALVRALGG
jgi:branched-subunit amino acid transport protein